MPPRDRRGHGQHGLGPGAGGDGDALAPDRRELGPDLTGGAHDVLRAQRQILTEDLVLQPDRGVRQQDEPDAGGVQRQPPAHPVHDPAGVARGKPLDQDGLVAVADREQDVLSGGVMQVLHVRQGGSPQAVPARRERREFQQPEPDRVLAVVRSLEGAELGQLAGQPQRGRLRQRGPDGSAR